MRLQGLDARRGRGAGRHRGAAARGGHGHAARRREPLELPAAHRAHDPRAAVDDARLVDGHRLHQRRPGQGVVAAQGLRRRASIAARTSPAGWWLALDVKPGVVGRWARIEILVSDDGCPSRSGTSIARAGSRGRCASTRSRCSAAGGCRRTSCSTPTDTEGQRTEMRYLEVQFDVPIPDDTFSLSRLEQTGE